MFHEISSLLVLVEQQVAQVVVLIGLERYRVSPGDLDQIVGDNSIQKLSQAGVGRTVRGKLDGRELEE